MAVSNIDRFNELTGLVLVELYAQFPVPKTLVAGNFVEPATRWCEHVASDVPSKEAEFFYATVIWLGSSGYLSYREVSPYYIRDVVLTASGLEVLKASPASLDNGATFGEAITAAAKEGGKETFRASVSELMGIGARLLGSAVGLP
ncbi:hypothetical protein EJ576_08855 [Pseudomonas sp. C 49-2]|uniref:hypothetical protein n=1 Tax=Pseudomonas sp. C 49-2 TaxID=2496849 RepID=UPI000F8169B2|nr:hypothetical protein [Pseudomonas sp. C 49-2]RTY01692.1 hypothetical protein EJ576_08855 [Pseudomonas sp. C 49-2]